MHPTIIAISWDLTLISITFISGLVISEIFTKYFRYKREQQK